MKQFEELYRVHYQRIYLFLYKLSQNHDTAEELTQETFYQAYLSLHRFRGNSEVYTWLASIAKHSYYKHLRRMRAGLETADLETLTERVVSGFDNPEEHVEREFVKDAIRAVVQKIPPKYSDVVMLRVYAELPFAEVARALGITENSAKVIYYRAKKMLLEELKHDFTV